MLNKKQLVELIIRPSLYGINAYSLSAEHLLLGTCAQESKFGTYLKQIKGPALGIFQMEPNTHDDIIKWAKSTHKWPRILSFLGDNFSPRRMIYDLNYATVLARLHYLRVNEPLPDATDIDGIAAYWKKYYNTNLGKGTEREFIDSWVLYGL